MAAEELKRLKDDLSMMRQAMKLDKPYDAADIPVLLLFALGGAVAIPLLWWQVWQPRLCLAVAVVPSRRSYLFGGIAVVAFGLAMPALSPATIPFAGAALAIVVGLGGAALLGWQTQADSARAKDKPRESEVIKAHP